MKKFILKNVHTIIAFFFAMATVLWAAGCPARVSSPLDPANKLTRAEIQIELDTLVAKYELKLTTLDQEERLRKLILQNAFAIASAGTVNPLSVLTTLLAFYGAGTGVKQTVVIAKKKLTKA